MNPKAKLARSKHSRLVIPPAMLNPHAGAKRVIVVPPVVARKLALAKLQGRGRPVIAGPAMTQAQRVRRALALRQRMGQ